ncbi:MAG: 1-(5-phosphoribosyl)-5-[(5-phosphoribosylamino)methylideneamino] imidazole-4-carboxamide isomerase [Clostridia bacterium]|nr:1-(5-phosphoribosyl)-5-[(5-phosphoribosylamino)methylideneamino] imidazole-4-carboxamide isomerase [Clostridia bacterium]
MTLFPAIDVLDGRAVRLLRGKKSEVTDYGTPLERAELWAKAGAEWLHVVDLGGAFDGSSHINDLIYRISKLGVRIQSGGGLRTMEDIADRIASGASRVVLGTIAYTDPELFRRAIDRFGEKIVVGIDARDNRISLKGWTEEVDEDAVSFAKKAKIYGVKYAVFTDISKDGAMQGVSLAETARLSEQSGLKVVASGGISSMDDLYRLKECGIYGAILGKSIYEGVIDLKTAIGEMKHAL